jgi:hypothetical protein
MKVKINPDIYLVAPLAVGQDLTAGDVVELDTDTAPVWIKNGWAVPVEETEGSSQ